MLNTLENLFNLARERKKNPVDGSYTNKLLNNKSFSKEKVMEEINELIEAVENDSNQIHEAADVFYHLTMYLEANDVKIGSIGGGGRYDALTSNFGLEGVSGVGVSFGLDRIYLVLEDLNLLWRE